MDDPAASNDLTPKTWRRGRAAGTPACMVLFLCAFLLAPALSSAQELSGSNRTLGRQILALLERQGARQAYWGVQVVSVKDGKQIVGLNQDKLFIPASTAKLFPAAAALARLGLDFRYRTTVEATGSVGEGGRLAGDLVLVGRGDPNLSGRVLPYDGRTEREETGTKIFEELAAEVFTQGVRVVEGNLVVDDSYFVSQPYGPGWEVDDLQWGYGAPVSALAINDNVVVVDVLPGARAGEAAVVRIEPMEGYYQLDNRVITVPRWNHSRGRSFGGGTNFGHRPAAGLHAAAVVGAGAGQGHGMEAGAGDRRPAALCGRVLPAGIGAPGR